MTDIREYLSQESRKIGVSLSETQLEMFQTYLEFLLEVNVNLNLTAITEPFEAVRKHFIDCLLPLKVCEIPQGAAVADVGTGAGFPGMVLKIARPDLNLTLIDSLQKRLNFLDALCEKLGLSAKTLHLRAQEAGKAAETREHFDLVTARAVAPLNVLSEYCLPLVKIGGVFLSMKSLKADEELAAAKNAIAVLGGGKTQLQTVSLYEMTRSFIIIEKTRPTPPKYPRLGVKITKAPL